MYLKPFFQAFFHGETWYTCPHCGEAFEFYMTTGAPNVDDTNIRLCPRCKKPLDFG